MGDESLKKGQELLSTCGSSMEQVDGIEHRAELFLQAANEFKSEGRRQEAATNFVEAANCYRKVGAQKAIECLQKAIHTDTTAGHHVTLGEIYQNDVGNPQLAAENFEKAAEYYRGAETNKSNDRSARKCSALAAHLHAESGDFVKAASMFEELGRAATDNSAGKDGALKNSAKYFFFKACLCHMNIGALNCQQAMRNVAELNPSFANTGEYQLLQKLVAAANPKEPNPEAFEKALAEKDSILLLDEWTVARLHSVKKALKAD